MEKERHNWLELCDIKDILCHCGDYLLMSCGEDNGENI